MTKGPPYGLLGLDASVYRYDPVPEERSPYGPVPPLAVLPEFLVQSKVPVLLKPQNPPSKSHERARSAPNVSVARLAAAKIEKEWRRMVLEGEP